MKASVESGVGQTPVMAVAVSGVRWVVVSVSEKLSVPVKGQATLTVAPFILPAGILTRRSLRVGAGVTLAPITCMPSLVAASRSVIAGELSAGG